jgi:hypothetical protein
VLENRMICERKPMFEDMSPYIESSVLIAYALPTIPSLFSQLTALLAERRGDTASQAAFLYIDENFHLFSFCCVC